MKVHSIGALVWKKEIETYSEVLIAPWFQFKRLVITGNYLHYKVKSIVRFHGEWNVT